MKNQNIGLLLLFLVLCSCNFTQKSAPGFKITKSEKTIYFKGHVDCNMAEVWIKDTFRIFPGSQYGSIEGWPDLAKFASNDLLRFASGNNPDSVFNLEWPAYVKPVFPPKASGPFEEGIHGCIWFEAVYKDVNDPTEQTLFALYHNEISPSNYPSRPETGEGYSPVNWPVGLLGDESGASVCRIGIMKSLDGGRTWADKGIVLEDKQPRMILKPHNTSIAFAGGVGDPSAVASGDYLYIFYGEYGYPGNYDSTTYDPKIEWEGQCISIARIPLEELDNPAKKAKRWDGKSFTVPYDGVGKPIAVFQIPAEHGGGATSTAFARYYWGPSVSWNTYLQSWVMMMSRTEAPRWVGSAIFISFNTNKDLGVALNSQDWSEPQFLVNKPLGDVLWYPSLQPTDSPEDIQERNTSVKMGKRARLYYKHFPGGKNERYLSEYEIEFVK